MALPPPETDADRKAWRDLFKVAVEGAGSQTALGELLNEDRTLINKSLNGSRTLFWTVLRKALRKAALENASAVPDMVADVARILFDARGRWVPDDSGPDGGVERDLTEEGAALDQLKTNAQLAVVKNDPVALRVVEQEASSKVANFITACRQEIGRRQARADAQGGQQRLAFGGRR